MKCPQCKQKINKYNVISECVQEYDFETKEYGSVEEIYPARYYECPECMAKLGEGQPA